MDTKELTAAWNQEPGDWTKKRRLVVTMPNVPEDVARAHMSVTSPHGMVVCSRRGPKGGHLNVYYWAGGDSMPPIQWPGRQWYIVVAIVKEDD